MVSPLPRARMVGDIEEGGGEGGTGSAVCHAAIVSCDVCDICHATPGPITGQGLLSHNQSEAM